MKSDRGIRIFLSAFLIALVAYVLLYSLIESNRVKHGPWQVEFASEPNRTPVLKINQFTLGLTNIQIVFADQTLPVATNQIISFSKPRQVPYDLPFGRCVFLDTTFLPGTVTLQAFGYEIELLPRVLVVDHQRRQWSAGEVITLPPRKSENQPAQ